MVFIKPRSHFGDKKHSKLQAICPQHGTVCGPREANSPQAETHPEDAAEVLETRFRAILWRAAQFFAVGSPSIERFNIYFRIFVFYPDLTPTITPTARGNSGKILRRKPWKKSGKDVGTKI